MGRCEKVNFDIKLNIRTEIFYHSLRQ